MDTIQEKKDARQGMPSTQEVINACLNQDLNKLTFYYQMGVNFDKIYDKYGNSVLHLAIKYNKPLSFSTLLSFDVAIDNLSLYEKLSPLNMAAIHNKVQFVEQLIEHGADVNSRAADGFTPLNNAAYFENYAVVNALLKVSTVDVNIPSQDGTPPVYMAFFDQQMDVLDKITKHPTFDVEFNLILLNDTEDYELKDYLNAKIVDSELTLLDAYQQAKLFALKFEFDINLSFECLQNHQYNSFGMAGYANRLGAIGMADSFQLFYDNLVYQSHLPSWAAQSFVNVNESLHFSASIFDPIAYYNKIQLGETVIIPSGWDGHSIVFVVHGDTLYRCNRGDKSDGVHGIEEFHITKPSNLTVNLINDMLVADGKPYHLQTEIVDILGLQKLGEIVNPTQVVGNCVWTSQEAGLEASLLANFLDYGIDLTTAHALAKDSYKIWEDFDLNYTLKDIIDAPTLLIQNKIFDDLLIHSLEQHHNPFSEADLQRGVAVLDQLSDPLVFETFDQFIGKDLFKYDPLSYQTISYMKPYAPAVEPTYVQSWYTWLVSAKPIFSANKLAEIKDYHAFLTACDQYRQHEAPGLLKITDILDVSNTKPLENLFNAISPEIAPMAGQNTVMLTQMITNMFSGEEPAIVLA